MKEIPQLVLDEISQHLEQFFIPIFVQFSSPTPNIKLIGSGTLVEAYQKYYVLTAAHVWHETGDVDQIGFALPPYSSLLIPRQGLSPKILCDQNNPQWGPDLALLSLPSSVVGKIKAYKTFLNFPKQKTAFTNQPRKLEKGIWAVTGMVGELSDVQNDLGTQIIHADIQGRAFFGAITQTHEFHEYDYFDLKAKLELDGVPSSFCGLSGGGLWQVDLLQTKSKQITWKEPPHFRGVEFGQLPITNNYRTIRCHGPQGIFQKAWEF